MQNSICNYSSVDDIIFQSNPENKEFKSPVEGKIALVAGRPNSVSEELSYDLCGNISDCGFNVVAATVSQSYISASLKNCFENGLKLFVYNGNLIYNTSSFVNQFKDSAGLGGWLLNFNIPQNDFCTQTDADGLQYNVSESNKKIIRDDSSHPVFIGMSGDWNLDSNGEVINSFPKYIANIQELFQPTFWPYIYFPDIYKAGQNDVIPNANKELFYKSLGYFAYISRYTVNPFWTACRCVGLNYYKGYSSKAPIESLMRGIVFTSLAYGAQGIYYWNFRKNSSALFNAPLDENGLTTSTWKMVRTINEEVRAFNEVFYGCEMIDCRHFNPQISSKWLKLWQYPMGPLMSIEQIEGAKMGLLISHIFNPHNQKNYLIVIADPFATDIVSDSVKFRFNFSEYWVTIRNLIKNANGFSDRKIDNYNFETRLNNGDYLILSWE